jgi:P4 family phage/plasmid primase-like protien
MTSPLHTFLKPRRVKRGDANYPNWNITGIGADKGSYFIEEDDYETFLTLMHAHVFGKRPLASYLLERHRDVGPLLVDLDFRYEGGGALKRRFRNKDIKQFIAEYAAAMIYFSKLEDHTEDLNFYVTMKPMPEMDSGKHKDGIHIQCPDLITVPKFQFAIRGFLLQREALKRTFAHTSNINAPEDTFDVSVIHRNNWFLYGACKPDKAQYLVDQIWQLQIDCVRSITEDMPEDFDDLVEAVSEVLVEAEIPKDTQLLMQTLSIRREETAAALSIRTERATDWEELMIGWGAGKKALETVAPAPKNVVEFAAGDETDDELVVAAPTEDTTRVTSAITESDIKLAQRLARECIDPERRCGDYQDWVNVAICLKNIDSSDESFKIWCELTRRVDSSHKKSRMTDAQLREKWGLIRIDTRVDPSKRLGMGSLHHWAEEDNPDRRRSILSEFYTDWIINYAANTHVSIAEFVCKLYRHEFRCCKGASRGQFEWYQFAGGTHCWKHLVNHTELRARLSGRIKDEYIEAWRKLGKKANDLPADSEMLKGIEAKRKMLRDIERNLEMASFKDSVMRECQEKFEDAGFIRKLNSDPYLVGVGNGVLELHHYEDEARKGRPHVRFRDGRPDDFISFQMGDDPDTGAINYEPYDPSSPEQIALKDFFTKIYPDPVLREYVITLLAACLEGQNKEQKFYVMQGVGSNGKSMIELLMEAVFGDYGTSLSTTVFTRKRPDSGAANPDIITVQKRRYIHTGEPDDDEKINTSIMKQWSGGDRVAARGLFAEQEKFSIMGKIFMSCNELPPINKMDNGTWRRVRVIPHVSVFKDPGDAAINPARNIYEKDLFLEEKLRNWRTAFLGLLVHYYETKYLEHGLKEPDCVMTASNKYKDENDLFNKFFTESFVKDPCAAPITAREVRNIWRDWKRALGRNIELKESAIFDRMKEACGAGSTDKEFFGIRLIDDATDISGAHLLRGL